MRNTMLGEAVRLAQGQPLVWRMMIAQNILGLQHAWIPVIDEQLAAARMTNSDGKSDEQFSIIRRNLVAHLAEIHEMNKQLKMMYGECREPPEKCLCRHVAVLQTGMEIDGISPSRRTVIQH